MSIMFLYYSEEQAVKGLDVAAHTMDTNLISTGEFMMKFPSVPAHMPASCHDEFFKVNHLGPMPNLHALSQLHSQMHACSKSRCSVQFCETGHACKSVVCVCVCVCVNAVLSSPR